MAMLIPMAMIIPSCSAVKAGFSSRSTRLPHKRNRHVHSSQHVVARDIRCAAVSKKHPCTQAALLSPARAPVRHQKEGLLKVATGFRKFGWFSELNGSARKCRLSDFRGLRFFRREESISTSRGNSVQFDWLKNVLEISRIRKWLDCSELRKPIPGVSFLVERRWKFQRPEATR